MAIEPIRGRLTVGAEHVSAFNQWESVDGADQNLGDINGTRGVQKSKASSATSDSLPLSFDLGSPPYSLPLLQVLLAALFVELTVRQDAYLLFCRFCCEFLSCYALRTALISSNASYRARAIFNSWLLPLLYSLRTTPT